MKKQRATNPPPTEADLKRLQLELEVHQVELEMQNTSLLATQAELRAALERYTDFYEFAPVGYLSLNPDGEMRQLNLAAATLIGVEHSRLVRQRLQLFVSLADRAAFSDFLGRVFQGQTQACEVTLEQPAAAPLPMRDNPCNPCLIVRFEAISVPSGLECRVVMTNITARKQAEAALSQKTIELDERVKELECLYEMSKLVAEPDKSIEEIFKDAVYLIPPGWHNPEIACARIAIGEEQFMTDNFRQTPWRLSADLLASGEKLGSVEVCYLEERPALDEGPFLKEERALIDNLAGKISATIERERAKTKRKQLEAQSRQLQKAEGLSRMAGAIAHNFNNQLAA
ncbi:MAG: hypothetical protein WCK27_28615, partial [Verrucomicrobiota bacterium]